ncbi:MAG: autotransporter domain-containing protein [Desulfovibrionaceae bacterium]|nr:autotransporter domain-containing protein [Desulfovibrionaceae bacterium]
MNLKGSIDGPDSIDMVVAGGQLDVAGTVDVYSLENNGYLAIHGIDDDGIAANVTENFVNNNGATLETSVYDNGSVAAIKANRAEVAGTWALRPEAGFYANKKAIKVSSPFIANVSGWFSNVTLVEAASKTLTFQMVNTGRTPSFMATRAANAYSQYAKTNGAVELGRSLVGISNKASGDMQKLITALDWSLDGQGIGQALTKLGPEAYDASAKTSLNQQSEFNTLLTNHLLGYVRTAMGNVNRSAAGPNGDTPSGKWIGWGSFFGSTSHQGDHNDISGYTSQGVGFLGGADHNFDSGLTLGLHVGFSARRTKVNGDHDAKSYTKSAFIGGQAIYAPESWDGLYVTGQARIGLEDGTMYRRVAIGPYERSNESRWTAPLWSALLGVGKDFYFEAGQGVLAAGPLAWLEYSALYRPEISESYGKATRLKLDATTYESLQSALGGHASYESSFDNGTTMKVNALAAWRHELSEGTMRTSASFRSYGNHSFTSETEAPGRDALLLQGSLKLTHKSGFFAEVGLGGETLRTASSSFNGSLTMGLEF